MMPLTKEQKKIIYFAITAALFLFLFWFFVYSPQIKRFHLIKEQIKDADTRILEISSIFGGKDLGEAAGDMQMQLKKIENQLSNREETAMNILSEAAKKLNIEIKNFNSSHTHPVESGVSGRLIEELPITLNLTGEFMAINKYLDILMSNPELLVKVRELKIQGSGEGRIYLEAVLGISVYLSKDIL